MSVALKLPSIDPRDRKQYFNAWWKQTIFFMTVPLWRLLWGWCLKSMPSQLRLVISDITISSLMESYNTSHTITIDPLIHSWFCRFYSLQSTHRSTPFDILHSWWLIRVCFTDDKICSKCRENVAGAGRRLVPVCRVSVSVSVCQCVSVTIKREMDSDSSLITHQP